MVTSDLEPVVVDCDRGDPVGQAAMLESRRCMREVYGEDRAGTCQMFVSVALGIEVTRDMGRELPPKSEAVTRKPQKWVGYDQHALGRPQTRK